MCSCYFYCNLILFLLQGDLEILLKQGRDKLTALTSTEARQGKEKLSSAATSDSPTGSSKTRATAK